MKGRVSYLNPTTSFISFVNTTTTTQTMSPLTSAGTRWNNARVNGANSTAHGVYATNSLIWEPLTVGTYNCNFGDTNPAGVPNKGAYMQVVAHNTYDALHARLSVSINSDGTWQVIAFGSNGSLDAPTNGAFTNPNPQTVIASGNWLGSTGAGLGAGYTYSAGFSNQKNFSFYAVGPGGSAGNKSSYSWSPNGSTNSSYQYCNPGWNSGYSNGPPDWRNGNANGLPITTATNSSGSLSVSRSLYFDVVCPASMANAHGDGGSDYETYGEDNWYHRLFTIDLSVTITGSNGHTLTGQIPLVIGMHWNWATYGSNNTGGGGGGGGGCVVLDAEMYDGREAGSFEFGDQILVTDPYGPGGEANSYRALVAYAKPELQPCVEVTTSRGAVLKMSTTAPIPTFKAGFVKAPDLLRMKIAIGHRDDVRSAVDADVEAMNVPFFWDEVVQVKDIGMQWVQHLAVDHLHHCFWASSSYEWFVLHHNLKQAL
jgi:hypothetical protein